MSTLEGVFLVTRGYVGALSLVLSWVSSLTFAQTRPAALGGLELIFSDGFESGNLTEWDQAVGEPPGSSLPPDPAVIAQPYDATVAANIFKANRFLWEASDPVQVNVVPGSIDSKRASFLRGRVLQGDGSPLRGVVVRVFEEPQFGFTYSRADGVFDLAVNGGGAVNLKFEKHGFLPVFRTVEAPALDYGIADDVVLLKVDPEVTVVASNATEMQVARGEVETDSAGSRQATLIFPAGTTAELVMEDGSTVPVGSIRVRATEYTVGERGLLAMPAPLADNTAYTYAVELSADEAMASGAVSVALSESVSVYVENFLGFPVGDPIPAGYFDRLRAEWVPAPNGLVIKVLGESGGLASIDIQGLGIPAEPTELDNLGISEAELARLALLYEPGQELWRVRVDHFTPWDFNIPYGPPDDAVPPPDPQFTPDPDQGPFPPQPPDPLPDSNPDDGAPEEWDPCLKFGSVLECENQVLGESLRLTGVPFGLHYSSDRVRGRVFPNQIEMRVTGASIPVNLIRVRATGVFAGRNFGATFENPSPNQTLAIAWDANDRFGRPLHSETPGWITVQYIYRLVYYSTKESWTAAFAKISGPGTSYPGSWGSPREVILSRTKRFDFGEIAGLLTGSWDIKGEKLGGWSFDVHHRYNPRTRTLLTGDGSRRFARDAGVVAPRFAGDGDPGSSGDGGPAELATLEGPDQLAVGMDGSVYIADPDAFRVRRVSPDGTIATVAGTGSTCEVEGCGEGGPATQAPLVFPAGVGIDSRGRLLIADSRCVRRLNEDESIETVAGICYLPGSLSELGECDDCSATDYRLYGAVAVAGLPGGGFYVAERDANRIRHVGTDGIITTPVGTGDFGYSGDGGPARLAELASPSGLSLMASGELLIADSANNRIRSVAPSGIIRTVAGSSASGFSGDGGPATSAALTSPVSVAARSDGSFWIADAGNQRVRRVTASGLIDTIAGVGENPGGSLPGDLALQVYLSDLGGIALGLEGEVLVSDRGAHSVLRVGGPRPLTALNEFRIPNGDGSQVFIFDEEGRHLRTRNGLTGATLLEFGYTAAGYLSTITDGSGNVTSVVRAPNGDPTTIVGPYGQSTSVTLDANGYLQAVENEEGHSWAAEMSLLGLLTSFTDPNGHATTFSFNGVGRASGETDAVSGEKSLTRLMLEPNRFFPQYTVKYSSPENRVEKFTVWRWRNGRNRWHTVVADMGQTLQTYTVDGNDGTRTTVNPDGSVSRRRNGVDPVWGAQAGGPVEQILSTPGGLLSMAQTTEEATVKEADPFSLATRQRTTVVNGRTYTSTYEAALREWLMESPLGRQSRTVTDPLGRPTEVQAANLLPTSFAYDSRGRLESIVRGAGADERRVEFDYDPLGRVASITDPLLRQVAFTYDGANRVLSQTLPGGRTVGFTWDPKGNLTSLTPPGKPAHGFSYTPVDLTEEYSPPGVGQGPPETTYEYNLDRKPTLITRPDGQTIALGYDSAQRLTSITTPRGVATVTYDPVTGHVSSMETPEGNTLSYTMDGPLVTSTTWSGEVNGSVERTYDSDFRLASISVNGENPVSYTYDDDGLLIQAGDMSLTRDPQTGFLTGTMLGVVTTSYTYSPFGELATMSAEVSGTPIYTTTYTRDKLGRITTKVEMIQGVTKTYDYAYDPAGRLDTVTIDGILEADYDYDSNGNRLSKTTPGGTETGTYDDQDRMLTYAGASYTYTANGEIATKTDGADVTGFGYDAFGNLLHATLPTGTELDYIIDVRNRRIGKAVNGSLTQGFLWQGQLSPIAALDGSGDPVSRFVYATQLNVPDYIVRGGANYRILHDHLGSPRLAINAATGAIEQRLDYDEWGVVTADSNPGWIPFGYAGSLSEPDLPLSRLGARDLDPAAGRWSSKDASRFRGGSANLYEYAFADPINLLDRNGRHPAAALGILAVEGVALILVTHAVLTDPGVQQRLNDGTRSFRDWWNGLPPLVPTGPTIIEPGEPIEYRGPRDYPSSPGRRGPRPRECYNDPSPLPVVEPAEPGDPFEPLTPEEMRDKAGRKEGWEAWGDAIEEIGRWLGDIL